VPRTTDFTRCYTHWIIKKRDILFLTITLANLRRLKWYKNYKNRFGLAKVIVKNKMSLFYGSLCKTTVFRIYICNFSTKLCYFYSRISSLTVSEQYERRPVHTTRVHGPWTRVVCTGLKCQFLSSNPFLSFVSAC